MPPFFQCPICVKRYDLARVLSGRKARCKCGYHLTTPDPRTSIKIDPLEHKLLSLGLTSVSPVQHVAEPSPDAFPPETKATLSTETSYDSISELSPDKTVSSLLESLQERRTPPLKLYFLRQQAEQFALRSGFDHLISLPQLKGIDSYDFQERTVRHVLRVLGGRALLSDEVGLGKTIEAGIILKELFLRSLVRKILILTPASLTTQWKDEMFSKFHISFQVAKQPGDWTSFQRIIASIDTAKSAKNRKEIHSIKWDIVIVDEAHKLKDKKTLNWKLVNSIPKRYILLLSATPFQNDLLELFNLVTLLKPGQLYTEKEFRTKFLKRGNKREAQDPELLTSLLRQVMVRNRRSEVGVQFTQRIPETTQLDMFEPERQVYDAAMRFCREHFGVLYGSAAGLVAVGYLKQLGSSTVSFQDSLIKNILPRVAATDEKQIMREAQSLLALTEAARDNIKLEALLQSLKVHNDKVIVFTQYRGTQDYIAARLRIENISHVVFNGSLSIQEKDAAIGGFRGKTRILLSTESGGEGRNLQFAFRMVNYDLPWNPMRIEQRIGRIHRMGQTEDVFITNLSCRKTIEDYLLALLDKKLNLFRLVVGEVDGILGKMKFNENIAKIFMSSRNDREFKERLNDFGEEIACLRLHYENCKVENAQLFGELGAAARA